MNNKIIVIITLIISIISAISLLNFEEVLFEIYCGSIVSTFVPFSLLLFILILFLFFIISFLYFIFKDVQRSLNFILIFLPMSALPFILLGYLKKELDRVFIYRSSIIFFVLILSFRWFISSAILVKIKKLKLTLIGPIFFLLFLYILNFFVVDSKHIKGAAESCVVFISCVIFFYFILSYINEEKNINIIIKILVLSCIIQVALSSLNFFYYLIIKGKSSLRVEGMLRDYELFAEYLAINIPLIFYFIRLKGNDIYKKITKLSLPFIILVLFATNTRGAIISLLLGLSYYLFNIRKNVSLIKMLKIVLTGCIITGAALIILYKIIPPSAHIIERFATMEIGILDTRRYVWQDFIEMFWQHPILGYGMVYDFGSYLFWPHSTYFSYLLSMGTLGLVGYLVFLGGIIKRAFANIKINKDNLSNHELSVALNSSLIIFVVDSFKIEYLRYSNYQLFIWLIFALIVSLNEISIRKLKY